MALSERDTIRLEGARAFVKWIDEREWTIARFDDDRDEFVPAGLTQLGYFTEFCKDMLLIREDEVIA